MAPLGWRLLSDGSEQEVLLRGAKDLYPEPCPGRNMVTVAGKTTPPQDLEMEEKAILQKQRYACAVNSTIPGHLLLSPTGTLGRGLGKGEGPQPRTRP